MLMGFAIAAPVMAMIAIRAYQIARLAMEIGRDESLSFFTDRGKTKKTKSRTGGDGDKWRQSYL